MSKENYWEDLRESLKQSAAPRNTIIDERPFEEADFSNVIQLAKKRFEEIESDAMILEAFGTIRTETQLECVYHTLLLCGEHSSPALWTIDECIKGSGRVLDSTLASQSAEDLSSFLTSCDSKKQLHGVNLFRLLAPKLSKSEWKYYPAAVHCYCWILRNVKSRMGEFLCVAIPVPLVIIDDYEIDNKVIALRCLSRILKDVSSAELNWYVQIDLLKSRITPLLSYREANLIVPLIECTLEVMNKITSPLRDAEDLRWGYMDEIFTMLLPMMEYEQHIARRCAYSECLNMILEKTNISIFKWCPKILRIIDDYSKTSITELAAMKALHRFMLICYPFIRDHWRFINVLAGRIIYRSTNEESVKIAEKVLHQLEFCSPTPLELKKVDYIRNKRKLNTKSAQCRVSPNSESFG